MYSISAVQRYLAFYRGELRQDIYVSSRAQVADDEKDNSIYFHYSAMD